MTMVNVQFSDATEASIITYFASPQDGENIPHYRQVDASDARWKAFLEGLPAESQSGFPAPE